MAVFTLALAGCEPLNTGNGASSPGAKPASAEKASVATGGQPVTLTADTFDAKVLTSGTVAMVDFWAEWCGPCKEMEPVVADIAKDYEGKVLVGKVDADTQPDLVTRLNVEALPTFLFFKEGQPAGKVEGLVDRETLERKLKGLIGS